MRLSNAAEDGVNKHTGDARALAALRGQTFHAHSQLISIVFITVGPADIIDNHRRRYALPL